MSLPPVTQEELKEYLSYDKETGLFRLRKDASNNRKKAGDLIGFNSIGYVALKIRGKAYGAHRIAWLYTAGEWPEEIDHINGLRGDNRWSNLRKVTRAQNCYNRRPKKSKTGLKGVFVVDDVPRAKPYAAKIIINYKAKYLGYFSTPKEAHEAYCAASAEFHGEYGRTK